MKKLLTIPLCLSLVISLASCIAKIDVQGELEPKNDTQWGNFTIGENDPKTVGEQRKEIEEAMTRAINTETVWREVQDYNPTETDYAHIDAITFEGFEYQGQKTKVFAYIGFPEGASADSPVPGVVLLHGLGGYPILEWVRLWNEHGYAAICIGTAGNFPITRNAGMFEGESTKFSYGLSGIFLEDGYANVPPHSYPTEYSEVSEQSPYHGLTQTILAANILRQDKRVDDSKIGIHGISWGGIMAAQVIGYDTRFAFAIPVYGTAYLANENYTCERFSSEYSNALWAAEKNLDNAKMPILWLAYSDDNNFGIPSYVMSYNHTADFNKKNTLMMLLDWEHSHTHVFKREECFLFADWAIDKGGQWLSFETQPEGREISCQINVPENVTGDITAVLYYIDEPMSYSKYNKFGWGEYLFMDQTWQSDSECLTFDRESSVVSGTLPQNAKGYYINVFFSVGESPCQISSVYVPVE